MLHKKIKKYRLQKKLTQQVLATQAGMGLTSYSQFELGQIDSRLSTIIKICDALGLELVLQIKAGKEPEPIEPIKPIEEMTNILTGNETNEVSIREL